MKNVIKILPFLCLLVSCSNMRTQSDNPDQTGLVNIDVPLYGNYEWNPYVSHTFDLGDVIPGYKVGYVFSPDSAHKAPPPVWYQERPRSEINENSYSSQSKE